MIQTEEEDPFKEVEFNLKINLSIGIKKIFIANGFNNAYVLSKLDDNDIKETD